MKYILWALSAALPPFCHQRSFWPGIEIKVTSCLAFISKWILWEPWSNSGFCTTSGNGSIQIPKNKHNQIYLGDQVHEVLNCGKGGMHRIWDRIPNLAKVNPPQWCFCILLCNLFAPQSIGFCSRAAWTSVSLFVRPQFYPSPKITVSLGNGNLYSFKLNIDCSSEDVRITGMPSVKIVVWREMPASVVRLQRQSLSFSTSSSSSFLPSDNSFSSLSPFLVLSTFWFSEQFLEEKALNYLLAMLARHRQAHLVRTRVGLAARASWRTKKPMPSACK